MHVLEPNAAEEVVTEGWSYEVRRDLPRLKLDRNWRPSWALNRLETYVRRARLRLHAVRSGIYDVVHIDHLNYFTDGLSLPRLRRAARALVGWVHDVEPHVARLPAWLESYLLGKQYRALDRMVVEHPDLKRRLIDEYGLQEDQVELVPFPILPLFSETQPTTGMRSILVFGSLRQNKGLEVLLEAVRSSSDPTLKVVIAGRGDARLMSVAKSAARRDRRIRTELGYISAARKAELFREARLVVLPYTRFASQSGVLLDAYASGRPLVVSDVIAIGPTVADDETGLVVPPSDPEALKQAMERLLDDEELWDRCRQSELRVRSSRSPAAVAEQMIQVYRRAVERAAL